MRIIKKLPRGITYLRTNFYGAPVYLSKSQRRFYEAYDDCIMSFSCKEFGTIR